MRIHSRIDKRPFRGWMMVVPLLLLLTSATTTGFLIQPLLPRRAVHSNHFLSPLPSIWKRKHSYNIQMATSKDKDEEPSVSFNNETLSQKGTRLQLRNSPWLQFLLVLAGYTFHLLVLTQHQWVFSWQWLALVQKDSWVPLYRHFVGLGYDSIAGFLVFAIYIIQNNKTITPNKNDTPWKLPSSTIDTNSSDMSTANEQRNWPAMVHRGTFLVTTACLVTAYFATGRLSLFWQDTLYQMSAQGWSLTAPLFRAWSVLLGHLSWVATGTTLLAAIPAAPRFFSQNPQHQGHRWFRFKFSKENWWLWVLGGYFVSSWAFNVADWANHYILPAQVLKQGTESSVVSQLVAPEHNDRLASILGYIAPCITAPVWEEVLYRGFLLAGLSHWTGRFHLSAVLQAAIFSAHHMSVAAALPLFVLGYVWAVIYSLSSNLWSVCFIHALWNSRVFLGSWLGL